MAIKLHRTIDRIRQWFRYPQPNEYEQSFGFYTDSFDLDRAARLIAAKGSAEYLISNMRQAQNFATDYDLHEAVKEWVSIDGHALEFGVASGRTIRHWARLWPSRQIHGFDSFEGLPETWLWNIRQGHFKQKLPRVPHNVSLHVGWFDQTLPQWLEHLGPIAFLHIDCDLYSSTKYVLDSLADRLIPGTIILFDEYLNFPGWEQDEFRAWQEFVQKNNIKYEYLGFVSRHQQVCVRIEQINGRI